MVDHRASAERCRFKAIQCELLAKNSTSPRFAKCYGELAQLLVLTADLEEDFVRRDLAAKQQANARLITETATAQRAPSTGPRAHARVIAHQSRQNPLKRSDANAA
jgi:hypothetical protein